MMGKRRFKQEYRAWKRQSAPDLWQRIEGELKEHPKRIEERNIQRVVDRKTNKIEAIDKKNGRKGIRCSGAAAVAAVILLMAAARWKQGIGVEKGAMGNKEGSETWIAAETTQWMEEESWTEKPTESEMNYQIIEAKETKLISVPEDAVTVPEDSRYFSEAVLSDTELLCSGEVEDVSLEYDETGRAVMVVYQLALRQIYYAQNYISSQEKITVTSPIVKAEGDEVYILYQLQKEGTYLLPLREQEGDWELIYPFAPQIQITHTGAYLFHSGYTSLVNKETEVVVGRKEARNDYFYDRMLLRQDENFPAELLSLVKQQIEKKWEAS